MPQPVPLNPSPLNQPRLNQPRLYPPRLSALATDGSGRRVSPYWRSRSCRPVLVSADPRRGVCNLLSSRRSSGYREAFAVEGVAGPSMLFDLSHRSLRLSVRGGVDLRSAVWHGCVSSPSCDFP